MNQELSDEVEKGTAEEVERWSTIQFHERDTEIGGAFAARERTIHVTGIKIGSEALIKISLKFYALNFHRIAIRTDLVVSRIFTSPICQAARSLCKGSAFGHWTIGQPRLGSDKMVSARLSVGQTPKNRPDKLGQSDRFGQLGPFSDNRPGSDNRTARTKPSRAERFSDNWTIRLGFQSDKQGWRKSALGFFYFTHCVQKCKKFQV